MKSITVFTPTYNRAYCLPILYESLLRQTDRDFEWLVIDDGSQDTTRELMQGWISDAKIDIKYHYKENGGMHTGHNAAYSLIETELNVCVDSDDFLPDNGIELMLSRWRKDGSDKYGGMIGLDEAVSGGIIGTQFPEGLKECTYGELGPRYGVFCDKKLVYRTEVVKRYDPYPVFPDERFVPLYFPYLVDADYKLLCYNDVFCIVDYQQDGSTVNIYAQYFRHPKGFSYSRKIEMRYIPFVKIKFKSAIHYVATSIISKNWNFLAESPKKIYTFLAIPFGIAAYFFLRMKRSKPKKLALPNPGS
ncbi:MAG: glycosyltransferase family 2 protein [Flavobacterium sp.]|uniref:glycosyltransferase family 2 protein n=1 Tax=Flavobacterium sp. TaxID=239 RepID=UPI00122B8578|nr:glycosyltransferase family 2 protein [Flavobacterium sp.]RZJ65396.1 MAG: glycosyltransferase family 2 protein [Flavobacterium sp.]